MSHCIIIAEQFISDLQEKTNKAIDELESKGLRVHATQPFSNGQTVGLFIWYYPLGYMTKKANQ